jgi:mono/diheme cytochrome c family protein
MVFDELFYIQHQTTPQMKKVLKVVLSILVFLLLAIAVMLIYVKKALPNVGKPEEISIEKTPERIERGKYLANCVTVCIDCHSTRDWNQFSGPIIEGTEGKGGEVFDQKYGFPGSFHARNITPAGLSNWTDGEILRAIGSGVDKNGKALFPVMPHPNYGKLDREDLYSIIAYIRTLKPIQNKVPPSEPDFPMNFILNTIPQKAAYSIRPDTNNVLAYGQYIFTAAACNECHTKKEKGAPIAGMELAGGFEFAIKSGGIVRSANITPDTETGIGKLTAAEFVQKFKHYSDSSYQNPMIKNNTINTVMPWMMYRNMKETDIKAIYAYIRTFKPIKNEVVKYTPN